MSALPITLAPEIARRIVRGWGNRVAGLASENAVGCVRWCSRVSFHAFRRFRQAVLERSEVRQLLIDFWLGHENPDMASRYAKQLTEDMEFRRQGAEKVGLGFALPEASEREQSLSCDTCDTK